MGFAAAPDALDGASGKDTSLGAADAVLAPGSVMAPGVQAASPLEYPHLALVAELRAAANDANR
jgi:hypothetical protein